MYDVQNLLRNYHVNLSVLNFLQNKYRLLADQSDVHAQNYDHNFSLSAKSFRSSSPVENYVFRKHSLEKLISEYQSLTTPISELIRKLSSGLIENEYHDQIMLRILELHFWADMNFKEISALLDLPRKAIIKHKKRLVAHAEFCVFYWYASLDIMI